MERGMKYSSANENDDNLTEMGTTLASTSKFGKKSVKV